MLKEPLPVRQGREETRPRSRSPYPDGAQPLVGLESLLIVGGRDDEVARDEAEESGEHDGCGGEGVDHDEQEGQQGHQVAPQPRQPPRIAAQRQPGEGESEAAPRML